MPRNTPTLTPEWKEKIRASCVGKTKSAETRERMKREFCSRGHDMSENRITKGTKQGFYCKECVRYYKRNNRLQKAFGISFVEYAEMMVKQGDRCAICRGISPRGKALCVDHDHTTGKVRALLCDRCNQTLGKVQESPEILNAMIAYLTLWDER